MKVNRNQHIIRFPLQIINPFIKYENYFTDYRAMLIQSLIDNKKTHFTSIYKERSFEASASNERLIKYFTLSEAKEKIPIYGKYYKHYLMWLSRPKMTSYAIRSLIRKNYLQKALYYLRLKYGDRKEKKNEYDFNIKENIENCSTTITCDSKEQLVYPDEIFKKCKEESMIKIDKVNQSGFFNNEQERMSMKNLLFFMSDEKRKKIDIKSKLQNLIKMKQNKQQKPIVALKRNKIISSVLKERFTSKQNANSTIHNKISSVGLLANEIPKIKISKMISTIPYSDRKGKRIAFITSQRGTASIKQSKNELSHKSKSNSEYLDSLCSNKNGNCKLNHILLNDFANYIHNKHH